MKAELLKKYVVLKKRTKDNIKNEISSRKKILEGKPITVFNNGNMKRDFTYIDDIVKGILQSLNRNFENEIFNLGNNKQENLMDMINELESCLKKKANIEYSKMQLGDIKETLSDNKHSKKLLNYSPSVNLSEGIPRFISWLLNYANY